MRWQLFLAIASTAKSAAALEQIGEPEFVDGAWCYTYLSTYLAPVQAETADPVFPTAPNFPTTRGILPPYFTNRSTAVPPSTALEATVSLEPVQIPTSGIATEPESFLPPSIATSIQASAASTTSPTAQVSGQAVIFLIEPRAGNEKRDLTERDLGGFVSGDAGNAKICTFANTFSLAGGELLDGGTPIYYSSGDTFKRLSSEGIPSGSAITTGFTTSDGILAFVNQDLPNNQADFSERCQNGRIVGLDSSSTVDSQPSQSTQAVNPSTTTSELEISSSSSQKMFPTDSVGSSAFTNLPESISTSSVAIESTQSMDGAETTTASSGDLSPTFPSFSSSSITTEYSTSLVSPTTTSIRSQSPSSSLSSNSMMTQPFGSSFSSITPFTDFSLSSDAQTSSISTSTSISTESISSFSSIDSASSSETTESVTSSSPETTESTTAFILPTTISAETETTPGEAMSTSDESTIISADLTSTTADITTTTTTDITTTTAESTTTTGCNSVDPLTTVALANPTPVFDDALDHDDDFTAIVLPFAVGGSTTVYVSTNGVVSVGAGTDEFNNDALPSENLPAIAFAPYWDDLYLSRSRGHTIVYEVFNGQFGNEVTFEFLIGRFIDNGLFHFEVSFLESQPNAVRFQYYTTPEKGSSATVGIQNRNTGKFILVEYNEANSIADGAAVIMSSDSGAQIDSSTTQAPNMSEYTTVSDGVVVTDNGIPPPEDWTNNYEEIGGDMMWGQDGQIENELRGRSIDGDVRPHFGMAPYTGEALYLFEIGSGQFFFFNAIDGSMLQIKNQDDLQSIVTILDDENQGIAALDIEEV
ncbi:hypothetical protein KAF25_006905 [Fusarium avenaceum]|uniref:DUF7908 domain-containing protein n=1 Tax=Fusarium avenaceum TaxID=40199 RepID=A0A9P7GW50_9HYPO|nr:hypothetical protein KAF25_006905 [Fusarium avenaceum]